MEDSQESKGWSRRSTIEREEESGLRQANGDGPQSLCFCKLGSEAALCRWLRRKTTIALRWDCGVLEGFSASGCFVLPWTCKFSGGKKKTAIQFGKYGVLRKKRKEMEFNAVGIPLLLSLQLNAEP